MLCLIKFCESLVVNVNFVFFFRIDSPLARLYSTSTMEHHHFDHCLMILHSEASFIIVAISEFTK